MTDSLRNLLDYGVLGLVLSLLLMGIGSIALWLKPKIDALIEAHLKMVNFLQQNQAEHTLILNELRQAIENIEHLVREKQP